jgi:hypothetical protein
MISLDTNEETLYNHSSNQPGSAENSHSLTVQHETVARDQQYESIVDAGYEHLIVQYEAVHNNTLVHVGEVESQVNQHEGRPTAARWVSNVDEDGYWQILDEQAMQVNQLEGQPTPNHWVNNVDDDGYWQILDEQAMPVNQVEGRPTANRWVSNVDEDGYWQVLNDQHSAPLDAEAYMRVLIDNDFALSGQPGNCNQRVRQTARVDSNGYQQPVAINDAEVHALPTRSLNSNNVTVADSDSSSHTAQDDTQPNPLYTTQDDTQPNPLYTTQEDIPPNPLYTTQDDIPPNPLYTVKGNTQPSLLHTKHDRKNRPRLVKLFEMHILKVCKQMIYLKRHNVAH